ncbi:unnamed protein product [Didymodactylos carnosus]|uniref:Conserved oligomeric Golgi complex subunit 1 n=1 Tax=Didymodactylos carnosus TaxID=1234261 RepID=A0A813R360_9BILA|nr:unnamed protein product [Didymodactylos carnosus]CAF0850492.1 unnamed protein product [Didymodactylos carnosus]CAF3560596.1 unnamed protein product [Didymodactylos carnosus]CAF3635725.1 unnamed protein product [Didymodactylos carnosus]
MEIEKLDIDSIFVKYTIKEIVENIDQKIKVDMEKKKEELRSMVGERYRELIEAADEMFSMKKCAKEVETSVHSLNEKCSKVDNGISLQSRIKKEKDDPKISLAITIKILTDTRRRCWMYLEENNFTAAARQYLLAAHMASSFELRHNNDETENIDPESQKAIICATRLWHQTRHIKVIILEKARTYLNIKDADVNSLANALSTLIALGNKSVDHVLTEFLNAKLVRQNSKDSVRQLLVLFINSIFEIDTLFSRNDDDEKDDRDMLKKHVLLFFSSNYLPQTTFSSSSKQIITAEQDFFKSKFNIINHTENYYFCLQFLSDCESVDMTTFNAQQTQIIKDSVEKWLKTTLEAVRIGLGELLHHIPSLKALLHLKSNIISLLTENRMKNWQAVCNRLLNTNMEISLWNDIIKLELRERAKKVLHARFDQFNQTALKKVEQKLATFQMNLSGKTNKSIDSNVLDYIWSDVDNNIPSDYVWHPSTTRLPIGHAKFSLKAVAIPMDLQILYREFDDELDQILSDVNEFVLSDVIDMDSSNELIMTQSTVESFTDSSFVAEYLEDCVFNLCTSFVTHIKQLADDTEKSNDEETVNASLIWLSSCARTMPIACKNLKYSLGIATEAGNISAEKKSRPNSQSAKFKRSNSNFKPENSTWLKTHDLFMTAHTELFKQWLDHLCLTVDAQLRTNLKTFLDDLPNLIWDEIEIEESLDTDKSYKSVIRIPMYCTPFIEEILFNVCKQINRTLAHGLEKELSIEMASRLLHVFLNVYEAWLIDDAKNSTKKRIQTRVLQIIYDLRFVYMLLERKDGSINAKELNERFMKLIDNIEAEVDPFDLNVLLPYMQAHLQKMGPRSSVRTIQKNLFVNIYVSCQLLFGHLVNNDRLIPSKPLPMNTQDTNNILLLSSCSQRFSLLPIAGNIGIATSNQSSIIPISSSKIKSLSSTVKDLSASLVTNSDAELISASTSNKQITSNVAEVATYYSKWFSSMVN